ncbi:hypothetical protein ACKWTF_016287 [Chironomus riparius]
MALITISFLVPGIFTFSSIKLFNIDSTVFKGNHLLMFSQTFTILYFYSNFVYHALFFTMVLETRVRYKKINEILEDYEAWQVKYATKRIKIQIFPSDNIKFLKEVSKLHLSVNSTTKLINIIFSFPIMIGIGFCVASGVLSFYEIFSIFSIPNVTMQQIGFCLIINAWLPNTIISIFMVTTCCMITISERDRTVDILENLLCNETDGKVMKKLRIFQQQIIHSKVSFSCGLFELQWNFLGTVS